MTFTTLLGQRDFESGLKCLRSLRRCGRPMGKLLIFEDGTLKEAQADLLRTELSATIVPLRDREEMMEERLAAYPRARAYRRASPLSYKLLDIPFWMGAEDYIYTDSDVFFLQPFDAWSITGAGRDQFVFMRDLQEAYSARLSRIVFQHRLPLPSRVNTGFWWVPSARYDLDFIEWFLGVPEFRLFSEQAEQTCWALMTRGRGVSLVDQRQLVCATDRLIYYPETIAIHFVFTRKAKLATFAPPPLLDLQDSPGAALRLVEPPLVGPNQVALTTATQRARESLQAIRRALRRG